MEEKLTDFTAFSASIQQLIVRTRKGVAVQSILAAIFLFVFAFGTSTTTSQDGTVTVTSLVPANWATGIFLWAILSLVAMGINHYQKPFITPEIKKFNCHFCGAEMATSELKCQNCQRISR
ncbi:MAG TPA: hypothetical protein VJZ68_02345 [Nitrososphaera sp.]|nr:hypothetical protein [Nitrososphaera sp.]